MNRRTRSAIAGWAAAVLALLAGCNPSPTVTPSPPPTSAVSASPTPTATRSASPTPSPTPTWDAGQTAAVAAIQGFFEVSEQIEADPAAFTEKEMTALFKQYTGGEMIEANVNSFMNMRKNGWRYAGRMAPAWIEPTKVVDNHNERGLEVHVTVCQDQTAIKIVDASGDVVADEQAKIPAFLLRQYSVRRPAKSETWLVFGMQTIPGECGP